MMKKLKNIKFKFLLFIIILLLIDLFLTHYFPASRTEFKKGNILIVVILFTLFLWRNGIITTKSGIVIANTDDMEKEKYKTKLNLMYYFWFFFIFIGFIFLNVLDPNPKLANELIPYKIYIQIMGFILVIIIIYTMTKKDKIKNYN